MEYVTIMAGTFLYCSPVKSGQVYPPVNTVINQDVTDWRNLPIQTQTRHSITNGVSPGNDNRIVVVDNFLYGLIVGPGNIRFERRINGVVKKDTNGQTQYYTTTEAYGLDADAPIYGYSVTPTYLNVWTDQSYIDTSSDVLYGRRGLYFIPSKNNNWDYYNKNDSSKCGNFLFGVNDNCFRLLKDGNTFRISIDFAGNNTLEGLSLPLKGSLKAEAISTANLENVVYGLKDEIKQVQTEVSAIQNEITRLIPDLTKLVNEESSKFYVSR